MQTSSIPEFTNINNSFKKLFLTLSAILSKLVGIFRKRIIAELLLFEKQNIFTKTKYGLYGRGREGYFVF